MQRFRCSQDEDIENFLRNKAVEYEKRKWCSTYLLINEDKLADGVIFVEGFFSLAFKALLLSGDISNNQKRKLFNGLIKKDEYIPVVLVGQLGKFIDGDKLIESSVSSIELIDRVLEIVEEVNERIPLKCIMLECKDIDKLCELYSKNGFKRMRKEEYVQYFKVV